MTFIAKALIHRGYAELFSSGGGRKCVIAESIFHRDPELEEELRRAFKLFITGSCRESDRNVGKALGAAPLTMCNCKPLQSHCSSLEALALITGEVHLTAFNVHLVPPTGLDPH